MQASVWPERISTPPSLATSGKTWPGRTKSAAPLLPLASARTVLVRSSAEMPVVSPWRTSTVMVKAVPSGASFAATIGSRCSRRASSADSGAADFVRPGHVFPLVAKEGGVLMRSGHTEACIDLCRLAGLAPVGVLSFHVANKTPNRDLALEFINFAISKEPQEGFANGIEFGACNVKAELKGRAKDRVPPHEKLMRIDWPKLEPKMSAMAERWQRDVVS